MLVADDDADIVRFVEVNLRLEGYSVVTAADGEQALSVARAENPDLVLLDVMMPKIDGYAVCQRLRSDGRHAQLAIIMLTAKSLSVDKVVGLTAGADDYIIKPFDPLELVARVKSTLRRRQEMLDSSPLTKLPGNRQIEREMERRVSAGELVGVLHADYDNFKAYNDRYGFLEGDKAINFFADILRNLCESRPNTFVGHIGGDDFVVVTAAEDAEAFCRELIKRFGHGVARLYEPEDAGRGYIELEDRQGRMVRFPLLSISIGAATNLLRQVSDYRELVAVATEMKTYAKQQPGNVFAIDRRAD
ncbi:MAG: response regulator [Acidobacteria bacterium]|nr:response regulator [Acidobacteriota bacterium]